MSETECNGVNETKRQFCLVILSTIKL